MKKTNGSKGVGLVKPINKRAKTPKMPDRSVKPATPRGGVRANAGRKSDYTPDLIDKLRDFFNVNDDAFVKVKTDRGESMVAKRPPTFQRFAAIVGISRAVLLEYTKAVNENGSLKYPEFSKAYEIAKSVAEAIKLEGAIMKLYDPKIVAFDLQVNHGWIPETVQHIHHTMDEQSLEDAYQKANIEMLKREEQARKDKEFLIGEI